MTVRDVTLGVASGALLSVFVSQVILPRLRTRQLRSQASRGTVYLVGAGPGDPELLTLKARRLVASATVVVVDDLVSPEIYALIPKDCEIIYVGKRGGKVDSAKQVDIDVILVDKCRSGHIVVRLKAEMDFDTLAKVDTIVLLMATRTIESICANLVENGKDVETPVALIHSGTNPDQVTLLGSLGDIAAKIAEKKYSPAIIVIGQVAKYGDLTAYLDEADDEPVDTNV
ncbi:hypothetical protein G195_010047 [Phytophthora kernoviae 00238/432]|uniref:uroporphyrinogen-III C-methyltransferase n=2 Tax=Phytophthora kernoviae TaxID=325452 RepID=A0A8T0LNB6_9STRA|nr:hypothetical protein G195_010047 [Phytophthora kernoviae 00238/432]KAG2510443.1 hypothetical protein JM16_008536 [Phytophthora kernoviae]